MKLLLFILIILFITPLTALLAQSEEKEDFDFGVAIVPQYAFDNTMRLDFDFTLQNNNVLTVAPMFSFARHASLLSSDDNYYADPYFYDFYPQDISLTGAGLKLVLRHFFGDFNMNSGLYLGGGLHYRYSHVKYEVADEASFDAASFEVDVYDKEEDFNQFGIDFTIGYQMYIMDNIYGDVFAGWGFRMSDTNDDTEDYWSETVFDLAYSGYTPLAGLRLGIFF